MYLLDTNVLSELRKRKRNPNVANWVRTVPGSELHLSTITFFEIERGIESQRRTDPAFAKQLSEWQEFTLRAFGDRILPLTVNIAHRWGRLSVLIGNKELDLAIAATALEHGLTVVTGNTKHFERTGVKLLNPFRTGPRK